MTVSPSTVALKAKEDTACAVSSALFPLIASAGARHFHGFCGITHSTFVQP